MRTGSAWPRFVRLLSVVTATCIASVGVMVAAPVLAGASTYSSAVVSDGASNYWRFNVPAPTDEIGGWNGSSFGGAVDSGAIVGDSNNSVLVHGPTNDWLTVGNPPGTAPTPQTTELWFKTSTSENGSFLLDRHFGGMTMWLHNGHVDAAAYTTDGATTVLESPSSGYVNGSWHYAVMVADGGLFKLYVDAGLVALSPLSAPIWYRTDGIYGELGFASDWNGGGGPGNPTSLPGDLDEVAFYPTALSVGTIRAHYSDAGYTPPALATPLSTMELGGGHNSGEPQICACHQYKARPVDTKTGNFFHTFDDLSIPGRGPALDFSRTYNSYPGLTVPNGPLGYGWSATYTSHLTVVGSAVTVTNDDGAETAFVYSGGVVTQAGQVTAALTNNGDGTWTYSPDHRLSYRYDGTTGHLLSITDPNGYQTTLAYDGSGHLSTVTEPAGRTFTFTWTGSNITGLADSTGRSLTYAYNDGNGNLTDVIDTLSGHSQFTYDANHRMLTMRSPRFYGDTTTTPTPVTTNVYDSSGRVTSQTDPVGNVTAFDYTTLLSSGGVIITDPNGNKVADYYNSNSLLTKETRGYGTAQAADWLYSYDPYTDGVATITDPNLNVTTNVYDPRGNVLITTDALSRITYYGYDQFNDVTSMIDPNGTNHAYTYDSGGNLTGTSTPCVNSGGSCGTQTTSYAHTDGSHPGDVTSMTDARGKTSTYGYDTNGDRNSATDPLSNQTKLCFDAAGRETATISPIGVAAGVTCTSTPPAAHTTYFTYDAANEMLTSTDPLGHATTRTYDGDHNLQTLQDPNTNVTTYHYDPAEELKTVDRPDTTHLNYTYDGDGNQLTYSDGSSHVTTYTYSDPAMPHATTSSTPPVVTSSHTSTYAYDGAGNVVTKQDPGGNCGGIPKTGCTTYGYDAGNQLTSITYSDGTTPNVSGITYTADGQRTAMTDGSGTSTWSWDSLNRLTSTTNGAGTTTTYGYDLNGNQTTISYPGAAGPLTRGFDDDSRLQTVSDWQSTPNVTTFNYNADSVITSEVYPNGTTATFTPDGADRLSNISDAPTATPGSPYATFGYTRDNANQITGVTPTGVGQSNQTYGYTALNQLHSTNSVNYSYDSADNLTATPSGTKLAYDNANELCWTATTTAACASPPTGATTYSYNSLGQRTAMTPPTGDPTAGYSYDQAQRLTSLTGGEYRTDVLAANPFIYWRLGDPSGSTTAADSSGNVHNGIATAVTFGTATSALSTDANKAATFNGTTSHLDSASLSGVDPTTFSEEAWVKTSSSTGSPWIIAIGSTSTGTPYIGLSIDATTGDAVFNVRDNTSTASTVTGTKSIKDGLWHQVVGTRGPDGAMSLYVDGQLENTFSGTGGALTVNIASIGAFNRGGLVNHFLTGSIDEAAYYPSQLTHTQVSGQYQAGRSNYAGTVASDGPAAYWRLGEASGTTANDASGNAINGTYVGGTGVTYNVTGALTSDSDKAVTFNGTSAYMWSATAVNGASNFTEEAWVKTTTSAAGAYFVGAGSSTSTTPITGIDTSASGGKANFVIRTDSNLTFAVVGATTINNGAWHHIVGVRNGSAMLLYVDGKLDATGTISSSSSVTLNTTTVGALKRGTNVMYYLAGTVDEAAIYPLALGADAVARHRYNGVTATPIVASYTYNGDGLRTSKTVGGITQNFTWDPTSGVPLMLNDGTTNYIYGPGNLPIEQLTGNVPVYYQQDGQGSTRVLANQGGTVVSTYSTDEFGKPTASSGTAQTPLRYDAEYRDPETGLIYLRARYYDPTTGQMLSRDPLTAMTGAPYSYVDNDPLNGTDPTGLCFAGVFGSHCKNVAQKLTTAAAVVGGVALVVATGGAAAAALPEGLAALDAGVDVAAVTAETGAELGAYGQGLASAGTALSTVSTAASLGSTIATCANEGPSASCIASGLLTVAGGAAAIGSFFIPATAGLATIGVGILGSLLDLAGFADYNRLVGCKR
jgi:RHS repeat-associated protein